MAFNNQEGIPDYNETPDTNFFKFDGPYPTQQKFTGSTTSYLSELTLRQYFLSLYSFLSFKQLLYN